MSDCIFCKIAAGEIPSNVVYEDEEVFGFLDINPLAKGHTLVIPKKHAVRMDAMTPDQVATLFRAVGKVLRALTSVIGRTDSLVAVHNGPAAGQEVPHVHVHVVPRSKEDGAGPIHALFRNRPQVSKEENEALADRIQSIATPA